MKQIKYKEEEGVIKAYLHYKDYSPEYLGMFSYFKYDDEPCWKFSSKDGINWRQADEMREILRKLEELNAGGAMAVIAKMLAAQPR